MEVIIVVIVSVILHAGLRNILRAFCTVHILLCAKVMQEHHDNHLLSEM